MSAEDDDEYDERDGEGRYGIGRRGRERERERARDKSGGEKREGGVEFNGEMEGLVARGREWEWRINGDDGVGKGHIGRDNEI